MSNDVEEAERAYRVVDALYRLHRDLFAVEAVVAKASHLQARLVRHTANGQMATLVAGMLVLVPILIALGDIKWGSAPAVVIYVVTAGVIVLWLWQAYSAKKLERELASLERDANVSSLEDREDFVLEEVNASVVRHRMVESIVRKLRRATQDATDTTEKQALEGRLARYEEILAVECEYVKSLAATSLQSLGAGKRSSEEHATLLDWCRGMPGFQEPQ